MKVPFKKLDEGDQFKYNTFRFVKGGKDKGKKKIFKSGLDGYSQDINATCLTDSDFSAYFSDWVLVEPIENPDKN